eukprot:1627040-Rhodomonas_salina.1
MINANTGTGLLANVKEITLEQHYCHPYSSLARVSKKLLYVSAIHLDANTELLSTYDTQYWNWLQEGEDKEGDRQTLPDLPPPSSSDMRNYLREDAREVQLQIQAIKVAERAAARLQRRQDEMRGDGAQGSGGVGQDLSLIHISEPTRPRLI